MLTTPGPTGLYDPRFEHDACGVSFVAHMKGERSNELVRTGLLALTNLEHRGATGAEPDTGDGAGILIQVPDRLLRDTVDFDLPAAGAYATGLAFLPADRGRAREGDRPHRGDHGRGRARRARLARACRSTPSASARRHAPPCRASGRSFDLVARAARAASRSTAVRTWRASGSSTSFAATRRCTSRRCRLARSSTRACSPRRSSASSSVT